MDRFEGTSNIIKALDYDSMNQVSELIKELAKSKIIFVVTHDYEFICQTCTRILHFDHQTITNDFQLSKKNERNSLYLLESAPI